MNLENFSPNFSIAWFRLYESALKNQHSIKSANYNLLSAEKNLAVAVELLETKTSFLKGKKGILVIKNRAGDVTHIRAIFYSLFGVLEAVGAGSWPGQVVLEPDPRGLAVGAGFGR